MKNQFLEFDSDKITVRGPLADGGFLVSFYVGEYEQSKVASLLKIPQQTVVKVKVTKQGDKS